MISVEEAWAILDQAVPPRPAQPVDLDACAGCALATPALADTDQPPFDRSSIDGFAVPEGSGPGSFRVLGEILPGSPAPAQIGPGEAWRVFTGSALPPSCALVMVEDATDHGASVECHAPPNPDWIRLRGSTVRAGDCLLDSGCTLGPGELAILASAGIVRPTVTPPPRVLHLTTGREIVPPAITPGPGQIRNTNAILIRQLLLEWGAIPVASGHVDESVESLIHATRMAPPHDVLLVSGGSSVGAHDRTPQALADLGYQPRFQAVAVRPGKPLLFAVQGAQIAFGLPGNPVSHFASFHLFVLRALRRLAALPRTPLLLARLAPGADLRADRRETFWPCTLHWDGPTLLARPRPWLDSGDLTALPGVDGLLRIRPGPNPPTAGHTMEVVPTRPIRHWRESSNR